jgi:hypothetical protein
VSIFYICGKPGSGKSYVAVEHILKELADPKSDRYIVTNIELKFEDREYQQPLPFPSQWRFFGWLLRWFQPWPARTFRLQKIKGLVTWCHENIKHEVNLNERVRILDDSECGEFWNFEPGYKFEKRRVLDLGRRKMEVPDFEDRAKRGCLYVIDEVHIYFGARDWQNTGSDATFFLSQHRKLQCDVILITQHPEQTDKALRRLAQEYMTMRNLMREPVLGFRLGNLFRYVRSLNSPLSPNPAVFETGFIKLKPEEIGGLYDTTAGVGIAGRVAPRSEKRGRSLGWLLPPILAVVIAVVLVFTHISAINSFIAHSMQHAFFAGGADIVSVIKVPASTNTLASYEPSSGKPVLSGQPLLSSPIPIVLPATNSDSVYCVGYVNFAGIWQVFLSDGRDARSDWHEVQRITHRTVTVFGITYPVRLRSPAEYVPSDNAAVDFPGIITPSSPVNDAEVTVIGRRERLQVPSE